MTMDNELERILEKGRLSAPDAEILSGVGRKFRGRRFRRSALTLLGTGTLLLLLFFAVPRPPLSITAAEPAALFDASAFYKSDSLLFCLPEYGAVVSLISDDETDTDSAPLLRFPEMEAYPVNL